MFNRILVAIDGSDHSQKALQYSIEFAKKWNAELHIVSVVPSFPPHLTAGPGFNIDQYMKELERARVQW